MTTQVNIRMSDDLIKDIDTIADNLHISRADWMKTTLAKIVREEKDKLLFNISEKFARGQMSEKELKNYVDEHTAKEMIYIKKKTQSSLRAGHG